ncbi:ABC transporter ATP-binding protein [Chloroflexota bacterium]
MTIIKTTNLTKKFKELVAVDNLGLEIAAGECFGLLGPNGAGKTSIIRMITGVSPPTGGEIWVDGKDLAKVPREVKAILGVVPQIDNLDPDLRVLQNLLTFARYFNIPGDEARRRSMEVLHLFQLEDKQKSRIKELSGGMKRRLLIARGLINQPRIIILDEPSIGLDPQSRHLVWQKLTELKSQGVTQLLCTQNMEEALLLCDRIAIIHLGKILAIDTPRELISRYTGNRIWEIELTPDNRDKVISQLTELKLEFEELGNIVNVFHIDDKLAAELPGRPRSATLEDVFFRLTGRTLIE